MGDGDGEMLKSENGDWEKRQSLEKSQYDRGKGDQKAGEEASCFPKAKSEWIGRRGCNHTKASQSDLPHFPRPGNVPATTSLRPFPGLGCYTALFQP